MNRALSLLGLLLPVMAQATTPNEALLQQAVSEGRVRPFHEVMEVASRLPVRVLRVDLGEEDGIWLYELKLIDSENSVIKVGYRADNLEMVWLKGHHLERLFEPRPPQEEDCPLGGCQVGLQTDNPAPLFNPPISVDARVTLLWIPIYANSDS